ncbi:unnamed protein product [Prorocentrum cordatum]|uniref:Uncharacterized protein n=1 Tax=Prorocentrum cordatum TaxID=2364126 RepID=A0ABN9PTG5_9DINO|nr:unnamed protein product [Polarella glacialis]
MVTRRRGDHPESFRGAGLLQALQEASPCWPRPAAVHRQPSAQPRSPEGDFVIVPMPPDGPNGGSPRGRGGAGGRGAEAGRLCGAAGVRRGGRAPARRPGPAVRGGGGAQLRGGVDTHAVPGSDTQKRVERLAQKDYSAAEIAEALGEEVADVARSLRKSNHNLRVQHKLFLHLRPSDFTDSWRIRFSIVSASRGRKVLAEGSFPLSALLESSTGKQDGEVVCSSVDGHEVKLDVELGLLVLIPRTEEGADQQCSPGTDESVFLDGHRGAPSMLKRQTTRALGSISKKSFETCCMRALRSPSAMTTAGPRATASPAGPLPVIVGRTRSQAV